MLRLYLPIRNIQRLTEKENGRRNKLKLPNHCEKINYLSQSDDDKSKSRMKSVAV